MRALARVPADRFASAGELARALTTTERRREPATVGRRTPVPQPQRRSRERILRRRDHRGRDRAALEDPLPEGDLAGLGHAVQEDGSAASARSAPRWKSRPCSTAACGESVTACGSSPSSSMSRRTSTSVGRDVRPAAHRHLRHPDGRRPADRLRAQGGALSLRADQDRQGAHQGHAGLSALPAGPALVHTVHRGGHF